MSKNGGILLLERRKSSINNNNNNRKASLNVLKNLLPIVQENYYQTNRQQKSTTIRERSVLERSSRHESKSTQCELSEPKVGLQLASWLNIPSNALFHEAQSRKLTEPKVDDRIKLGLLKATTTNNAAVTRIASGKKRPSLVYLKEIGVQTYELNEDRDVDLKETVLEDVIILFVKKISSPPKLIINFLEKLTLESMTRLLKYLYSNSDLCQSLITLSPEKVILLEKFLSSSNDGVIIDLKEWLKNVNNSSSVSLSRGINDNEERKLILKRFRKLVRMVILNLEWFKALNKDYSKRKNHENLLHEFYDHQDQLSDKLLQQTFNKDDFRAPRGPKILLKDQIRHILMKEPNSRSQAECETLAPLIASIPHLCGLPKHTRSHLARLLRFSVYEKGRVIVRNRALFFYYIVSGACDVLTLNRRMDAMIKTDDLEAGDVFGEIGEFAAENRHERRWLFLLDDEDDETDNKNGDESTKKTIVVNPMVELLVIDPLDIREYLDKMKQSQKHLIKDYMSNWLPVKIWSWTETNLEKFCSHSEVLKFDESELIYTNVQTKTSDSRRHVYMIMEGRVDMIKLIDDEYERLNRHTMTNEKKIEYLKRSILEGGASNKLFKICSFHKYDYFGLESNNNNNNSTDSMSTWFIAGEDETSVLRISQQDFVKSHEYGKVLLAQMIEDYELSIPSSSELRRRLRWLESREKQQFDKFLKHSYNYK